ncbi:MAG: ParA family protein [Lachnospirales bacterium]
MMMKIIRIGNSKGGVGKSTVTVSLAVGLARKGKRVLVCDLDSQGSATIYLGFKEQQNTLKSIEYIIDKFINDKPYDVKEIIVKSEENVDLIPANIKLAGIDITLNEAMSREMILQTIFKPLEYEYDYLILDCGSNLGILNINALTCANEVIIPTEADELSVIGMEEILTLVGKVRKVLNPELKIGGVLFTNIDLRLNLSKNVIDEISTAYNKHIRVFNSVIPPSVRVKELSSEGKSIFLHDPNGKVAEAYESLVLEVLNE